MATIEKPITRLNLRRQLKLKLQHQQEKQHRGHLQLQLQLQAQFGKLRHSKHHQDSTSSVPQSNNYTHRNLRTHRQLTPPSLEHHNHNQNYSNAHDHEHDHEHEQDQRQLKYDDTSDEDSRKLAYDIKRRTSPPATDLPSPTATEIDEHDLDHEFTEENFDGNKCQMSGSRSTATTETTTRQQQQQRSNTKIHRARSKSVSFVLPQELLTPKEEEDEEEIMTRQKRRKLDSHKISCKEENGKEEDLDNFSSDYPATPPESCSHEEEVEEEEEEAEENDNDNEENSKQLKTPNEINHTESQIDTNVQDDSIADKLAENTDYIALQSALGLIESQSKQIKQEMIQLSHLQKYLVTQESTLMKLDLSSQN
ncbi:predicted protein [Lodderomyces elongisporus NRRL YB-4239]|uniref:Uncharacterized protein n=1 Tax=Lodderomyces elongisporus (strain ATCC 11503 / CBS 2605 / JCM 1781 / NBRC 1676 / NRRL YB-4239) TaxID=379508 RepID=A5DWM9_LODEL|nr:predicted protein [Lodderomyces elongisporus NRRL YB-4239]